MSNFRPTAERGRIHNAPALYGTSFLGAPLQCWESAAQDFNGLLVLAGTHGDESEAVIALSAALRSLPDNALRAAVILSMNPDGSQLGTRANARGVDLNRNFPTEDWQPDATVYRWSTHTAERDVILSPGHTPASEPETKALLTLIEQLQPRQIVTLHAPLACVEDEWNTALGRWLAERFELPLVANVGYGTPGSFGTWCREQGIPVITLEFPDCSASHAIETYTPILAEMLAGNHPGLPE